MLRVVQSGPGLLVDGFDSAGEINRIANQLTASPIN
jgi:hypothetical protein